MKLILQDDSGKTYLEIVSDGHGRYTVTGDRHLPRRYGKTNTERYTTSDGLHVLGLVQLMFGANDSREYLTRALSQHEAQSRSA